MKSTRANPDVIMVFRALHPAPPTPITLIRTGDTTSSSNENIWTPPLNRFRATAVRCAQWLKELEHPGLHTIEYLMQRPSAAQTSHGHLFNMVPGMEQQADTRGMHWITDDVAKPSDPTGRATANRKIQDLLCRIRHPFQQRRSACNHRPCPQHALIAGARNFPTNQLEYFFDPRLKNLGNVT